MNEVLERHVDTLVTRAKGEISKNNFELAWKLLEDAHIFSQPIISSHLFVHWQMLRLAMKNRDVNESIGQVNRLLLAMPSTMFRLYPKGNNGRVTMGIFESAPVPKKIVLKMKELERVEKERLKNDGKIKTYQRQHPLTRR